MNQRIRQWNAMKYLVKVNPGKFKMIRRKCRHSRTRKPYISIVLIESKFEFMFWFDEIIFSLNLKPWGNK